MGDEFTRVRSQAFWLAIIALALAAIVGGYVSGNAAAPPLQRPAVQPHVAASVHAVLKDPSDSSVVDEFSEDDVVVDRPQRATEHWLAPRLAIVVGLCGYSPSNDAAFMALKIPIAFDVDPAAPQASDVVELARESGDVVLLHLEQAPTQAQLARLRRRFGRFEGVASRTTRGFVQALDGTGLLYFDERGDANPEEFTEVDIPFVQRDETVDDRTARSYIRFMLARAVSSSQREGRSVVFMRPLLHSREALESLAATRSVQFTPLTQAQ